MRNTKSTLKHKNEIMVISLFILVIIILLVTGINNNYTKTDKLYISEIMPKNTYTVKDDDGEYSDYIEIYNGYNNDINLEGYHLSDSEFEVNKWTFPNITIKSHDYLLIFASGKNKCSNNICHTSYKLSSKGEIITLTDKTGNIINKFSYPLLSNDLAYGFINNNYKVIKPSPNKENKDEFKYSKITNKDLYINEYMSNNRNINYDTSGKYNDFVELYNHSSNDINLNNIFLSDDIENLIKYKLPDRIIKPKEYFLIYLSDTSKIIDNEIWANFKLSEKDKYLIISNGNKIIDKIELVDLIENISYGRIGDDWFYFTKPTPGEENKTIGHKELLVRKEENS